MFTVSIAATDRNLLTLAEMKAALGIAGSASDDALIALGLQISDMISAECRLPFDGINPRTLRKETIIETFRANSKGGTLILSRRFVNTVISIVENGVSLTASDYEVKNDAGVIDRLNSIGEVIRWSTGVITITYSAGFEEIHGDLRRAAIMALREQASSDERDPLLKRYRRKTDGVSEGEWEYWVNSSIGSSAESLSGPARKLLENYDHATVR